MGPEAGDEDWRRCFPDLPGARRLRVVGRRRRPRARRATGRRTRALPPFRRLGERLDRARHRDPGGERFQPTLRFRAARRARILGAARGRRAAARRAGVRAVVGLPRAAHAGREAALRRPRPRVPHAAGVRERGHAARLPGTTAPRARPRRGTAVRLGIHAPRVRGRPPGLARGNAPADRRRARGEPLRDRRPRARSSSSAAPAGNPPPRTRACANSPRVCPSRGGATSRTTSCSASTARRSRCSRRAGTRVSACRRSRRWARACR